MCEHRLKGLEQTGLTGEPTLRGLSEQLGQVSLRKELGGADPALHQGNILHDLFLWGRIIHVGSSHAYREFIP